VGAGKVVMRMVILACVVAVAMIVVAFVAAMMLVLGKITGGASYWFGAVRDECPGWGCGSVCLACGVSGKEVAYEE
jgi:hypothetical protein